MRARNAYSNARETRTAKSVQQKASKKKRARVVLTPANCILSYEIFFKAPLPDDVRECAVIARLASNLEVLGRGLAAIGNLFVFDRLSFVECRKARFLDCRNMNKNVFAATGRLDESKSLGRVEPLHSTLSHHVVSAGSKTITNRRSPQTVRARGRTIRGMGHA